MSKKATGLCKLHYATVTVTDSVVTFGTPTRIPDAEEVSITDTFAEGENYADNIKNIYAKKPIGADINISISSLKREMEAALTGKTYSGGEMVVKTTDVQPEVAILYQKTYNDGSYDNIVYYNCKLDKTDESTKTSSDSIEFTGVTLTGKASPLENGELKYIISSDEVGADDTVKKAKLSNFFTIVQTYGDSE